MRREKKFFLIALKNGVGEEATNGDTLNCVSRREVILKKISFEFFYDSVVRHALGLGV